MADLFSLMNRMPKGCTPKTVAANLGVVGSQHGIDNGWFNWPYNFDPLWLESCNGFIPRAKVLLRFHWSPDEGDSSCICSLCRKPIDIEDGAIRMFEQDGQFELRFHWACYSWLFTDVTQPNLSEYTFEWGDEEMIDSDKT